MKTEKINELKGMEPALLPSDLHAGGGAVTGFLQGHSSHAPQEGPACFPAGAVFLGLLLDPYSTH